MNEQETPMDALDRRLVAYLEGHAEATVAFGPGPDHIVASMAIGGRHVALQGRRGGGGLRGVPTLAWVLLVMGLLSGWRSRSRRGALATTRSS